jgi:hypothetical protein
MPVTRLCLGSWRGRGVSATRGDTVVVSSDVAYQYEVVRTCLTIKQMADFPCPPSLLVYWSVEEKSRTLPAKIFPRTLENKYCRNVKSPQIIDNEVARWPHLETAS